MARRDRYNLSPDQERLLIEIREKSLQLIEGINAFGTNTVPHEYIKDVVEDMEQLLGY
jgi:hypothetical protein